MDWVIKFTLILTFLDVAICSKSEDGVPKYCDFIVVGSGAGGATVAARLSEVSEVTVCLFEAGIRDTQGQYASTTQIPRLWTSLVPGDYTWNTTTVPQIGMNGRSLFNGMGKALGGSTTHNGMINFRGFKADFDYWEEMGAKGWNYESVLPYFRKSENMTVDELKMSPYHSTGGPIYMTQDLTAFTTPLGKIWKSTAKQLSIPIVDCNEPSPLGLCVIQTNIRGGKRDSTSTAFLKPAMGRRNFFVITEALVSRILINRKKAYGIRYIKHGRTYTVKAKREIIVSGGTFESPKLLQLSGIGPKHLLQKLNVRPHAFLPVGENIQDHIGLIIDMIANIPAVTLEDLKDPNNMAEYLFKSSGIWASNRLPLNVYVDFEKQKHNWPEFQYHVFDGFLEETLSAKDVQVGRFPDLRSGYEKQRKGISLVMFLDHPKSRGFVRARSKNAEDTPIINPRYFSNKDDIETLIKTVAMEMEKATKVQVLICVLNTGIRSIQKLLKNSVAMRKVGARLSPRPPGWFNQESAEQCYTSTKPDSDEFWKCVIRQQAFIGLHAARSCPMGSPKDRWAVVDSNLRVYGINGLRVVDASVMPEITSGNTMSPTIMIGEHAADIIKRDHNLGKY